MHTKCVRISVQHTFCLHACIAGVHIDGRRAAAGAGRHAAGKFARVGRHCRLGCGTQGRGGRWTCGCDWKTRRKTFVGLFPFHVKRCLGCVGCVGRFGCAGGVGCFGCIGGVGCFGCIGGARHCGNLQCRLHDLSGKSSCRHERARMKPIQTHRPKPSDLSHKVFGVVGVPPASEPSARCPCCLNSRGGAIGVARQIFHIGKRRPRQ